MMHLAEENNFSNQLSDYNVAQLSEIVPNHRRWLSKKDFSSANEQKRMWLKAVAEEFGLSSSLLDTLEALAFLTDAQDGRGSPSIGAIMAGRDGKISYNSIITHLAKLTDMGILAKEKGIRRGQPRHHKPPNTYTLIGYKYESEDLKQVSGDSLNPKGFINTYMQDAPQKEQSVHEDDVCFSVHKEVEVENKPKRPLAGHIDNDMLNSDDYGDVYLEVEAAAVQKGLSEDVIQEAIDEISKPGIVNKGGYLKVFLDGKKNGTWGAAKQKGGKCDLTQCVVPGFGEDRVATEGELEDKAISQLEAQGIYMPLPHDREWDRYWEKVTSIKVKLLNS